jgi:hypothetical protein
MSKQTSQQWHTFSHFQVLILQHCPQLITITLSETKDIYSNIIDQSFSNPRVKS